jgi:hypothetical protein
MTDTPSTTRGVQLLLGLRTRTITIVLMVLLVIMIVMDIFARRRVAAAAVRSQRDLSLVVR